MTSSPDIIRDQRRQSDIHELDLIRSFMTAPRCTDCMPVDPAIFTIAQIHIDMVTMMYPAMWFNMAYLPSVAQARAYIWQLSGQDASLIEYAKDRVRYRDWRSELEGRLEWLRVLGVLGEVKGIKQ